MELLEEAALSVRRSVAQLNRNEIDEWSSDAPAAAPRTVVTNPPIPETSTNPLAPSVSLTSYASENSAGTTGSSHETDAGRSGPKHGAPAGGTAPAVELVVEGSGTEPGTPAGTTAIGSDEVDSPKHGTPKEVPSEAETRKSAWKTLRRGSLAVGATMFLANPVSKSSKHLVAEEVAAEEVDEAALTKMKAWQRASHFPR